MPPSARTWAESSFQMHAVASAKGIRYFHFLQPNQYIEGTKPMSDGGAARRHQRKPSLHGERQEAAIRC